MPFSGLSSDALINTSTLIDNMFITDFMPNADEIAIKVYLYGLLQCANRTGKDNSLKGFSLALGYETKQIIDAVKYWESLGAVRIISENPLEYEYIPLKLIPAKPRKHDPEKYREFISQIENIVLSRVLTPNELLKYVETIEDYKITPDAMVMIARYCVQIKGQNIHSNYILTVAKAWAEEGVKTVEDVEKKLQEMEANTDSMRQVFYALGLKSTPDFDDKQQYIKWTTSWGYDFESILYTAKLCKKRGGMKKLDAMLDDFYKLGLFTLADIQSHSEYIEYSRNLAININKTIGVYYENIDTIVEQYVSPWLDKGYDAVGLKLISVYCLKHTIKTLEGMNNIIDNLYKKGIVDVNALTDYFEDLKQTDEKIKNILKTIGTSRMVTNTDRDYYNTWSNIWGVSDDVINYSAEKACGKSGSLAYLNHLISTFKNAGATTVEECEKISVNQSKINTKPNNTQIISDRHIYSSEELDKLFNKEDESNFDF